MGEPVQRCRSCQAEVVWKMNDTSGKAAMVDLAPVEGGNVVKVGEGGFRVLSKADAAGVEEGTPRFVLHFATCPQSREWRR